MASPSIRFRPTIGAADSRERRRRIGTVTDAIVLAVVLLFVVGAFFVGLAVLHSGLAGR